MNFDQFNDKSKLLINQAQNKAVSLNNQQISVEHLVFSILNDSDSFIEDIIENCQLEKSNLTNFVEREIKEDSMPHRRLSYLDSRIPSHSTSLLFRVCVYALAIVGLYSLIF